jgi:hypothetical protein
VAVTKRGRKEIAAAAPGHVALVRRLFIDRLNPAQLDALGNAAEAVLAAIDNARPTMDDTRGALAQHAPARDRGSVGSKRRSRNSARSSAL